ncbi:hypothetical protein MJO29_000720 [Puccinia striiformis f. sp. tritici]|uniref:hypothetical protein n=1 Tax=Puccinia striiformis f. sp. tritici TaxID=168172 RepID=UPI000A124F90|nr:hypothetical protein Pst134EA_000732 [Puccinia striiformis f. sp. tritici]KAH9466882.1 hypothetical protein Pst134EB_001929 [Puccinia striiformis f. sp. tritici]KAH9473653.1 hypothetical protein Pst134EA_000732 [Puccinia striiformis f. sp. tritici]KAI7967443.1 hypothetical protein MJO29_000720 [Puccinia striiformis f. sp. tritici]
MTPSNNLSDSNSKSVGDDPQDPLLASIRTLEAIKEFAGDIIPLRSDGTNIHEWVCEIDKTLSDLVDREKYLQGTPPTPVSKAEDKIARNLIYWTIPRELRSCISDTTSAHDAYNALQGQFLRNNRTSHMAALVDLFNVHWEISEPHHITMLYDRMHKGMNELVASGFLVTEDTMLGALFQIAVGRANSQVYGATSQYLDTIVPSDRQVKSREVSAAARRQFEHMRATIFDEEPLAEPSCDPAESRHVPVDEDAEDTNSGSGSNLSLKPTGNEPMAKQSADQQHSANVPSKRPPPPGGPQSHQRSGSSSAQAAEPTAKKSADQQHPTNVPFKRPTAPLGPQSHQSGSSSAQVTQPVPSKVLSSSATKKAEDPPVKQAAQSTKIAAEATQPSNNSCQSQPFKFTDPTPLASFAGHSNRAPVSPHVRAQAFPFSRVTRSSQATSMSAIPATTDFIFFKSPFTNASPATTSLPGPGTPTVGSSSTGSNTVNRPTSSLFSGPTNTTASAAPVASLFSRPPNTTASTAPVASLFSRPPNTTASSTAPVDNSPEKSSKQSSNKPSK